MSATNFSVSVPQYLVEQVDKRARAFGRSRNAEWRHLLNLGLEYYEEGVPFSDMPPRTPPWRQVTIRVDNGVLFEVRQLSKANNRETGPEILHLILLATEESARRDLAVIQQLLDSTARCS
ncbi:MAG: hypothetical protein ACK4FG_01890 [Brevundimonas sp.]